MEGDLNYVGGSLNIGSNSLETWSSSKSLLGFSSAPHLEAQSSEEIVELAEWISYFTSSDLVPG